ncbi:MAG: gliding motility-associated C-terminal domain-containing protein [Bacteroidales bacterium]|nr:gliding motility-associated C-terminal domain-containing protein [Bacteroidales bacterium]
MIRKLFIFALLSASSAVFAQDCSLLNSLQIPDTVTACRRDTLHIEQHTAFEYEWSNGTTNSFYVFPATGNIFGEIWVRITDTVNECDSLYTIVIDTFPIPRIIGKLNIDTTLCFGDTLILKIGETEYVDDFFWFNPEGFGDVQDSVLEVIFDTTRNSMGVKRYIVWYTGSFCQGDYSSYPPPYSVLDTAFVFFANRPDLDFGPDTTLCYDGEGFTLPTQSWDFLTSKYEFLWSNGSTENTITIDYDNQGEYHVTIWNNTCMDSTIVSDTVTINFWPKEWREPILRKTEDVLIDTTVFCRGQSVKVDAFVPFPLTKYHWSNDTTYTLFYRTINVRENLSFTITLTDSAGCQSEFSVDILLNEQSPQIKEHMPNIFTPNDDGTNDVFLVINPEQLKDQLNSFHLRIYNRWNREVYRFDGDPSKVAWDGTNGGSQVPDGVYFWVVKATDKCGSSHQARGAVTILR